MGETSRVLSLLQSSSSGNMPVLPEQSVPSQSSTQDAPESNSTSASNPSHPGVLEDYTTAQDSLRQASDTLDAAFNRLRELRRNLRSFRTGMNPYNPQSPNPETASRIGPSHAALVLSDSLAFNDRNSHSPSPPSSDLLNPLSQSWTELGQFRFISRNIDDIPSSTDSSDEDFLSNMPLPLQQRPQYRSRGFPQSSSSLDEPSTSIGRRVAARQGGETPASDPRVQRGSAVADLMRASRRQREVRSSTMAGPGQSVDRLPVSSAASLRALRDSRDRLRNEARNVSARTVSRLPRSEELDANHVESRNYRVRRRLNADGEELVYNIHIDHDSDFSRSEEPTWDVPPRRRLPLLAFPLADPEDNFITIRTQRPSSESAVPIEDSTNDRSLPPAVGRRMSGRRRGWARLDADGNEIPTDEEDALERTRAQLRVRDNQSHSAVTMFHMVRSRLGVERLGEDSGSFTPTTQSYTPGIADDGSMPYARVHINTNGPAVADPSCDTHVRHPLSTPYRVNPLPMPLEEMVEPRYLKQKVHSHIPTQVVKVSRYAQFAGR